MKKLNTQQKIWLAANGYGLKIIKNLGGKAELKKFLSTNKSYKKLFKGVNIDEII